MNIELRFTEEEMIGFLINKNYSIRKEKRTFDCSDIFSTETEEIKKDILVVYQHNLPPIGIFSCDEIKVADEKNYLSKSLVLKETFQKELKKSLLKL